MIWKNLKGHFSKTTFYGLHAGNNKNSIWKPCCNFAFPSLYIKIIKYKKKYKIEFLFQKQVLILWKLVVEDCKAKWLADCFF